MDIPKHGIFAAIASTPTALNAQSQKVPPGHYLVEIQATEFMPGKRSGNCYVIQFRVLAGTEHPVDGPSRPTTATGKTFSSVPKEQYKEVCIRELATFLAAAEDRPEGSKVYCDDAGNIIGNALSEDIIRAFHIRDTSGRFTNPYKGVRVFVSTEAKVSQSNRTYVRHSWELANPTLAAQFGYAWPDASAAPPPPPAAPVAGLGTYLPRANPTPAPAQGFYQPPPSHAPVQAPAPSPAPVVPPGAFAAPAAPPPAPAPAPAPYPGWEPSPGFPGWYGSPVGGEHVAWFNPVTGERLP